MSDPDLPLSDIEVLDLTIARAGPTAVRQLADWGAEVVRVEPPLGKEGFSAGNRLGSDFQNLHRNKRCITLNLKDPRGQEIFYQLAEQADVVVENYRADVKHRLGVDYETLAKLNPRIVYGSISGFGQSGPYGDRPGVDQIAQGMGGLMSVTGLPGQGPVRVGTAISDLAAGLYLAFGIMVALHERSRSGRGQWVNTSLLEAQIGMLDFQVARWLIEGEVAGQAGNHHPTLAPMGVFPTADGHINIAASSAKQFRQLAEAIGRADLVDNPAYADPKLRSKNREALIEEVGEGTRRRTSQEWIEELNQRGIPCGPINSIDQTMADPQVEHLGIATPLDHPQLGPIRVVGQPVHLERTPQRMRFATAERGAHTKEVLDSLGYDEERVAELEDEGVI